ncbi:MAG: dihydrodipicolinate synthase family protein [Alphaproteobacteria bacterium]|nr:MAG: dihydrodipicolinate synthase family protein [Alphaproteobacteria bacterium]
MLSKCYVAVITPFDENRNVDLDSFGKLVQYLRNSGVKGVVVGGTTGEGIVLSNEEKLVLYNYVNKNFVDMELIGCYSSPSLHDFNPHIYRNCNKVLVSPQYFIKPDFESVKYFFDTIISTLDKPVILYNNPSRFATDIRYMYDSLYKLHNVIGVKEAGQVQNTQKYIAWEWFVGNDDLVFDLQDSFSGIISALANVLPTYWNTLDTNMQKVWLGACKLVFSVPSPLLIKYYLYRLGIIKSYATRYALYSTQLEEYFAVLMELIGKSNANQ